MSERDQQPSAGPAHADNTHGAPVGGPLVSAQCGALTGDLRVPGDKSISHRALILGALAVGETTVEGLLEAEDVLATAKALGALGAEIARGADGRWRVQGVGIGGLTEPEHALDMGNAGTAARLLMGVVAGHPITAFFTGDASLRRRPMARVIEPLERIGATFVARSGLRLPLAVTGAESPLPIRYGVPVPSAQVKSAVLLAGLSAPGETTITESAPTRDHTERMLRHFGADIEVGAHITLRGQPELSGRALTVPGDISSAAFPLVGALMVEGSALTLRNVGLNPLRVGLLETIREMGGEIIQANARELCGEPVADLSVRAGRLRGVSVPAERAPSMIDEYPVLACLAACAEGKTRLRGLAELRVKESDRLDAIARGLEAAGVGVVEHEDGLDIQGCAGPPPGGGTVKTHMDHRIAMAFLLLGMTTKKPMTVDDGTAIATSFPEFVSLMNGLGAAIGSA